VLLTGTLEGDSCRYDEKLPLRRISTLWISRGVKWPIDVIEARLSTEVISLSDKPDSVVSSDSPKEDSETTRLGSRLW
jgi:hypothetical protein